MYVAPVPVSIYKIQAVPVAGKAPRDVYGCTSSLADIKEYNASNAPSMFVGKPVDPGLKDPGVVRSNLNSCVARTEDKAGFDVTATTAGT